MILSWGTGEVLTILSREWVRFIEVLVILSWGTGEVLIILSWGMVGLY